jgi:hypothetical protein
MEFLHAGQIGVGGEFFMQMSAKLSMKVGLSEDAELYKRNAQHPENERCGEVARISQIVR